MILKRGGGSLGSVQSIYEQKRFMTFKLGYTQLLPECMLACLWVALRKFVLKSSGFFS